MFRGFEVKEALRAQMEVQSKLHLQVEVFFSYFGVEFMCFKIGFLLLSELSCTKVFC